MGEQVVNHYVDHYWNDLPYVYAYMCRRATGDPNLWWMDYFKKRYATPTRRRALILGCGNGWVERDLYDRDVAEHFDAFDSADHYLQQARAQRGMRSIHYFRADFDTFRPRRQYDLIVNVAALHHVRRLYRFVRTLANGLPENGLFVNWDYVGPSRNQYSSRHLRIMQQANVTLPERFRSTRSLRPNLGDMLYGDPTEAVHAADILHAVEQYFQILERRDLGGGVAYQILWNNIAEFEKEDRDSKEALSQLIEEDDRLTMIGEVPTLFAFFVCRRRPSRSRLRPLYDLSVREPLREALAQLTGGYYPRELLTRLGLSRP